jgi:archaellum biogenesis ATPase FlaH
METGGTVEGLMLRANESKPIDYKTLTSCNAAYIQPEEIEWFWNNKIPSGALTVLAGNPGSGKSYLSLYLASVVSTGRPWPDCQEKTASGSVLLIGDEDDPAKVLVPRLIQLKADLTKIEIVNGEQGDEYFDLTLHLKMLHNKLTEMGNCRLVVIDPITAYLGQTNANSNAEVRAVLGPLANLAAVQEITVLGINHFNKKQGDSFIYRGLGSTGFVAQARSAWGVLIDKDDRETRIFCPIKSNYCIDPTGLTFKIIDGAIEFGADPWVGHIDDAGNNTTKKIDEAVEWLRSCLKDGPVSSTTILEEGDKKGFARDLCYRAKEKLKIRPFKTGFGDEGQWYWRLPDD